tara:strand:+ start:165 stop:1724 length:1560 start_codon:yes stop_codon:yes gene_type:complete
MKFISLFAGVGGFDLGMERAGHECVAQVEWDKNAAGVLKRRWPDVPLFCDVSKVTADDLPDADFITYGFPCQDLSVAGKRKGLEGERSGLFFEATRLIRELIARGSGLRFAVAENVAGLFSADDGEAFARCIRELLDCGSRQVGWRLLDSAYFGVAQRRKRVFIVSDFGGESCDEVLAVSESLRWHPAPSREAGQSSPSDAGGSFTPGSFGGYEEGVGTLRSQGGDLGGGSETLAVWPEVSMPCMSRDYKGPRNYQDGGLQNSVVTGCDVFNGEETGDTAATVTSATGISNASGPKVMAFDVQTNDGGDHKRKDRPHGGMYVKETDTSLTIGSTDSTKVVAWNGDTTPKASEDVSVTLRSQQGGEGVGVAHVEEGPCYENHSGDSRVTDSGETCPTLRQRNGTGGGNLPFVMKDQNLTVRRLTPREVMRLQGFDDSHCDERCELELVGNEWKATGKVIKQADGPIYKQAGNAVTVNVAEWIGRRLKRLQATYTPEELEELGVGTTYPKTLGEYLREDRG